MSRVEEVASSWLGKTYIPKLELLREIERVNRYGIMSTYTVEEMDSARLLLGKIFEWCVNGNYDQLSAWHVPVVENGEQAKQFALLWYAHDEEAQRWREEQRKEAG